MVDVFSAISSRVPVERSLARLRQLSQFVRRRALLRDLFFVFLTLVMLTDHDLPNRYLDGFYYGLLIVAFATLRSSDTRELAQSWILRICFCFLLFMWLTPLWTGGVGYYDWWPLGFRSLRVFSFALISAVVVLLRKDSIEELLCWLGWIAFGTALYSFSLFYPDRFLSERLQIFPWPNPNTGSAIFGLLASGIATGPAVVPKNLRLGYIAIVWVLIVTVCFAGTRAALLGFMFSVIGYTLSSRNSFETRSWIRRSVITVAGVLTAVTAALAFGAYDKIFRGSSLRDEVFLGFWKIALERFWLGHGIQNEFSYVVSGLPAPHNQLLTALLYGGIGAVLLYGGLYAAMLIVSIRHYRRGGSFAMAAMTIYLIVHGMFETVAIASFGLSSAGWRWLYLWAPIGFAAGLELHMRRSRHGHDVDAAGTC
jgi:hypothetical protein